MVDTREIHFREGYRAGLAAALKALEEWQRIEETDAEMLWGSTDKGFQAAMNRPRALSRSECATLAVRRVKSLLALLEEKT